MTCNVLMLTHSFAPCYSVRALSLLVELQEGIWPRKKILHQQSGNALLEETLGGPVWPDVTGVTWNDLWKNSPVRLQQCCSVVSSRLWWVSCWLCSTCSVACCCGILSLCLVGILPSIISCKSPSCLKTWPVRRCFLYQMSSVFACLHLLSWELPH